MRPPALHLATPYGPPAFSHGWTSRHREKCWEQGTISVAVQSWYIQCLSGTVFFHLIPYLHMFFLDVPHHHHHHHYKPRCRPEWPSMKRRRRDNHQLEWVWIWLVVWNIWIIFPFSWEFHDPNWLSLHHFSEGWRKQPTSSMFFGGEMGKRWFHQLKLDALGSHMQ